MNEIIGGTFVKNGKDSLEITANDLFDKIINLKFTRKGNKEGARSFIIRSDYEAVHHKDGTTSFKVCTQKPDIKITYKQVAESVAIEVDIRVTNFYVDGGDSDDSESMNSVMGDPVQWCTIQMGYRGQFPDWTSDEYKDRVEEFYDLASPNVIQRANQINVQILTGYPESYPPDRVMYFKGIIGTMETGLRWKHTEADLAKGYGDPQFPQGLSEIGEVLFQFITRRFISPNIPHVATTERDTTNLDTMDEDTETEFEQGIKVLINGKWKTLELTESGIMSVDDAQKYGVKCYISRTLQNLRANAVYGYGYTAEEIDEIDTIPTTPFNDMQNSIGAQLVSLQQHYSFLHWYELMDGSFYFYHVDDTDEDLWSDPFIKNFQKENTVFLPAIYDMTPSGTRSIRCPFISFLSPMTTVLFQSRYMIGTQVGYFYPPKTNAFLVITSSVSFATVQEDNMMELMCVDLPEKEVVYESGQVKVKDDNPTVIVIPETAMTTELENMQWTEKTITVVKNRRSIKSNFDTEGSWEAIVQKEVMANVRPERWPPGTVITEKTALEALMKWNPDYFDEGGEYMARSKGVHGTSSENRPSGIGGRTGIEVPWLTAGDKIIIRHPFQSDYPDDEKVDIRWT